MGSNAGDISGVMGFPSPLHLSLLLGISDTVLKPHSSLGLRPFGTVVLVCMLAYKEERVSLALALFFLDTGSLFCFPGWSQIHGHK
jgi:hypothetical protein